MYWVCVIAAFLSGLGLGGLLMRVFNIASQARGLKFLFSMLLALPFGASGLGPWLILKREGFESSNINVLELTVVYLGGFGVAAILGLIFYRGTIELRLSEILRPLGKVLSEQEMTALYYRIVRKMPAKKAARKMKMRGLTRREAEEKHAEIYCQAVEKIRSFLVDVG